MKPVDDNNYEKATALAGLFSIDRSPQPKYYFSLSKDSKSKFHSMTQPSKFQRFMQKVLLGIYWGEL